MEIGLLIKNYTDCKASLECAISYALEEMSCDVDYSSKDFLDCLRNRSMLLDFIIHDLEHVKDNIELLKELEEKGI